MPLPEEITWPKQVGTGKGEVSILEKSNGEECSNGIELTGFKVFAVPTCKEVVMKGDCWQKGTGEEQVEMQACVDAVVKFHPDEGNEETGVLKLNGKGLYLSNPDCDTGTGKLDELLKMQACVDVVVTFKFQADEGSEESVVLKLNAKYLFLSLSKEVFDVTEGICKPGLDKLVFTFDSKDQLLLRLSVLP